MSEQPTQPLADLTDDWPTDPANADLSRLGHDLFAHRPELSPAALERVHARVREEMARPQPTRRRRGVLALGIAVLALSLGAWAWVASRSPRHVPPQQPPATTEGVRDQFQVTPPPATPEAPKKGLIDPERDKALFGGKQ